MAGEWAPRRKNVGGFGEFQEGHQSRGSSASGPSLNSLNSWFRGRVERKPGKLISETAFQTVDYLHHLTRIHGLVLIHCQCIPKRDDHIEDHVGYESFGGALFYQE